MKIALYHGYELSGSGSNEYTRYLAEKIAARGHDVVLVCSEPEPEAFDFISAAVDHDVEGRPTPLFERPWKLAGQAGRVVLHRLPRAEVYPVYVTDKQRAGSVAAFSDLTDRELQSYRQAMVHTLRTVVQAERPDVLHANHLVLQPSVAAEVCPAAGVPYYVVPHGSALEYTVRGDARYHALAREGLACAAAVVWISANIRARVLEQFPDLEPHLLACGHHIGIGTDTTRFRALSVTDRDAQRHALAADHRSGGKRAAQREALRQAIKRGDIEATRRDWNSYDHGVEDEDFAERLPEIPVDGDVIAFVGALTWGKGVQSLVAAMPRVLRARPEAHLVIIGSGTYREVLEALVICLDTGNREMFEAIARRGRGLERDGGEEPLDDLLAYAGAHAEALFSAQGVIGSRVHFIGRLDHPRLARLLPCAKVAVFPSIIHEASPLVFAEALACGVLPAASNHSGFADGLAALQADLPASLWSPMHLPVSTDDRIETMAANVTALLERTADPALPERLRAIATARYDWSSIVEPLVRLGRALMVNV